MVSLLHRATINKLIYENTEITELRMH